VRRRLFPWIILVCLVLPGCVGTDVGNPQDGSEVELDAKGYESTNTSALTLPSGLRIDAAWISLSQFEFRSSEECATQEAVVEQPILVDVIANRTVTERPRLSVPPGNYCRLDAGFIPWSGDVPDGAPESVSGYSVVVEGARADGAEFILRSDMDMSLILNARNGAFALSDGAESLIIGFAVDMWFNENTLDAIDAGDGRIEIGPNSNPSVYNQFNAALRRSAHLYRDANRDNALGMSERAEALARGRDPGAGNNGQ
jgi:hypothetical protein